MINIALFNHHGGGVHVRCSTLPSHWVLLSTRPLDPNLGHVSGLAPSIAFVCSAITATATASPATAQDDASLIYEVNERVEADISALIFNYREHEGDPKHLQDKDVGGIPGVSIAVSDIIALGDGKEKLFGLIGYDYTSGGLHHYGLAVPPLNYTAHEEISTALAEVGTPIEVGKLLLIPVAELEYRDWNRSLPEALLSTREDYTFFAAGVGVRATFALSERVALSGKIGIGYTVAPQNAGNANPIFGSPAAVYKLGEQPVYDLRGEVAYMLENRVSVLFGLSYSHFGFGKSQSVPFVDSGGAHLVEFEPQSLTDQAFLRLGLAYSW